MQDILDRLEHFRIRAHRKARAHALAGKRNHSRHTLLGVPVVAFSAVVGTAIFATLAKEPAIGWKVATGLLSVISAVLASLQTFFRHAEIAEKHRTAAAEYGGVKRDFDVLKLHLSDGTHDRAAVLEKLELLLARLNKLEKDMPDVPDELYDQAVREQKGDPEGI